MGFGKRPGVLLKPPNQALARSHKDCLENDVVILGDYQQPTASRPFAARRFVSVRGSNNSRDFVGVWMTARPTLGDVLNEALLGGALHFAQGKIQKYVEGTF